MTADHMPEIIPIFPLTGALLLPFGQLPLNIFEPRYITLIEDALGAGRLMGLVQPIDLGPKKNNNSNEIYNTGCLGRITEFTDPGDGRYEIVLTGICRFIVKEELDLHRGYRRITANYSPFVRDLESDESDIQNREGLLAALRQYFEHQNLAADWDALNEVPDLVLVTTAAMGCPLQPEEKQLLLEANDLQGRAERLQTILEMAIHGNNVNTARH